MEEEVDEDDGCVVGIDIDVDVDATCEGALFAVFIGS